MKRWMILVALLLVGAGPPMVRGGAEAFIPAEGPTGKPLIPVAAIFEPTDDGKPPAEIKAAFEKGERTRLQREADTKNRIKAAVADQKMNRPYEAKELRDLLIKLRAKLSRLQAMKGHSLGPVSREAGEVGEMSAPIFTVSQVVDATNVLVSDHDKSFWISNVKTDGLVDGDRVSILTAVRYVGPKKYTSVLGAGKTVAEIQPFDISPYLVPPKKAAAKP